MDLPILIEPLEGGRFRARAGEPFAASVEAGSPEEARSQLELLLRQRLQTGSLLATVHLGNGAVPLEQAPLQIPATPDDDWFFQTMREAIAEHRHQEDGTSPS